MCTDTKAFSFFNFRSSENSFITRDCEDKTTNTLYPAQLKEISGKLWKNLGDFQIDEWNPDEQKTGLVLSIFQN